MGILVFYCHNIRSVKQHSFTISQFLQVRILGMTQLDLPLRSHKAEIMVLTGAASSFYASFAWGSLPDSRVIGRTWFFAVAGLKLSAEKPSAIPYQLALSTTCQFACSWPTGEILMLWISLTSGRAQFLLSSLWVRLAQDNFPFD